MKCKEAHLLIAGLNGESVPEALAEHIGSCPACAELLKSDVRLRQGVRSMPPPAAVGWERIQASIESPASARPGRVEILRRMTLMKITVPAAALLAAALFLGMPRHAQASQPLVVFRKMKTAILHKAKDLTQLGIKIGKTSDGSIGVWALVNGDLVQIPAGQTYSTNVNGTEILVKSEMGQSSDLSSLSPELRKQVEEAIQKALSGQGDGNVTTKVILNGKESDMATAQKVLSGMGIDFSVDIDLDEAHYSSIACGSSPNTLLLTKKANKDRRLVVQVDPKSNLPKSIRLEQLKQGKWVQVKQSSVVL